MDMLLHIGWDKMDYSNIEKLVVAPQIVIYKNIFKHSQELINLLETDQEGSLFSKWRSWYEQGIRKDALYSSYDYIDENSSSVAKFEKEYLKEIADALKFINEDYFTQFGKDNGIWPEYINDWSQVSKYNGPNYIDYFKYTVHENSNLLDRAMMMDYHVDEFIIEGQLKTRRLMATINFYLNDGYDGGEICMYDSVSDKNYIYKPRPGDAVIMPSTYPFYHAVKSYKNDNRYFLRSFFEYNVKDAEDASFDWEQLKAKEEEYVKNDLQLIKISTVENIIE